MAATAKKQKVTTTMVAREPRNKKKYGSGWRGRGGNDKDDSEHLPMLRNDHGEKVEFIERDTAK